HLRKAGNVLAPFPRVGAEKIIAGYSQRLYASASGVPIRADKLHPQRAEGRVMRRNAHSEPVRPCQEGLRLACAIRERLETKRWVDEHSRSRVAAEPKSDHQGQPNVHGRVPLPARYEPISTLAQRLIRNRLSLLVSGGDPLAGAGGALGPEFRT